jgi:hypothetical protein
MRARGGAFAPCWRESVTRTRRQDGQSLRRAEACTSARYPWSTPALRSACWPSIPGNLRLPRRVRHNTRSAPLSGRVRLRSEGSHGARATEHGRWLTTSRAPLFYGLLSPLRRTAGHHPVYGQRTPYATNRDMRITPAIITRVTSQAMRTHFVWLHSPASEAPCMSSSIRHRPRPR